MKEGHFNFADLFCGMGGMRLAFEGTGAVCVFSYEGNAAARDVYETNFGDDPDDDLRNLDYDDIYDIDILAASIPYQPFPNAGKGEKRDYKSETGGTNFCEVCRLIEAKRPKAFVFETRGDIAKIEDGKMFNVMRNAFSELGYGAVWAVRNAAIWTPQNRSRMIIIGFDRNRYSDFDAMKRILMFDKPKKPHVLGDVLEPSVDDNYIVPENVLLNILRKREKPWGITDLDKPAPPFNSAFVRDRTNILVPYGDNVHRVLTPRECARIKGFPDTFELPSDDGTAYRLISSSVTVPMMADVARRVVATLRDFDEQPDSRTEAQSPEPDTDPLAENDSPLSDTDLDLGIEQPTPAPEPPSASAPAPEPAPPAQARPVQRPLTYADQLAVDEGDTLPRPPLTEEQALARRREAFELWYFTKIPVHSKDVLPDDQMLKDPILSEPKKVCRYWGTEDSMRNDAFIMRRLFYRRYYWVVISHTAEFVNWGSELSFSAAKAAAAQYLEGEYADWSRVIPPNKAMDEELGCY